MNIVPISTMTPAFVTYMGRTLLKEGGERYTNDPTDRGGATKWGVTEARARASGYTGDMRALTREEAMSIYWTAFWIEPGLARINEVAPGIAAQMLDLGVNNGTGWPGKWLQRALNVLNDSATLFADVTVDGQVGSMTVASLKSFVQHRGVEGVRVLSAAMSALAGVRYIELAEHDTTQERFEFGWLSQRAFPAGK